MKNIIPSKPRPIPYPFGSSINTRSFSAGSGFRFGFNGKENFDQYQDYGFRIYYPSLGKFLSADPLIVHEMKYPELSSYQFASNTPICAIDLDGLEAFLVHGTYSNALTWKSLGSAENNPILNIFKNTTLVNFSWSGKNLDIARQKAAIELVASVKANMKDGEPITIVGHSHGGNVAILAANIMANDPDFDCKEINIVTINTPVREYKLSAISKLIINHYNIYDKNDPVQIRAGNDPNQFKKGNKEVETGDRKGLLLTGEHGKSDRLFESAVNIETNESHGIMGDFHNSHNLTKEWIDKLKISVTENSNSKSTKKTNQNP